MTPNHIVLKDAGAFLIGMIVAAFLLGIITVQAAQYYAKFPDDKIGMKILVAVLLLTQYFGIACSLQAQYSLTILLDLNLSTWYGTVSTVITAISSFFAQFFFAFRIRKMKRKWASLVISVISVTQLGLGLAIYIIGLEHPKANQFTLIVGWGVSLVLADVLIAVVMIISLRRNLTGFPRTDRAVKLLTRYVVHSGIATGIVSFLVLLTRPSYNRFPIVGICFSPMLGAVSTMTVLANQLVRLRVRRCFDAKTEDNDMLSIHISRLPARIREDILAAIPDEEPTVASTHTLEASEHNVSSV